MSRKPSHDPVNRPAHYTSGKVECIEAIESALGPEGFIAFLRGQVIKYQWRLGQKDAPEQEAGKSKWYNDLLCKKLKDHAIAVAALRARQVQERAAAKQAKAVPANQGEALTEKKEASHDANASSNLPSTYPRFAKYPTPHRGDCTCLQCHLSQP